MFMAKRMSQNECNTTVRYLKWGTVKEKDIFAQKGSFLKIFRGNLIKQEISLMKILHKQQHF